MAHNWTEPFSLVKFDQPCFRQLHCAGYFLARAYRKTFIFSVSAST